MRPPVPVSQIRRHVVAATALSALMWGALAATPARAVVITQMDVARGFHATPQLCAALMQTVWVSVSRYGFCIQYYLSEAGGTAPKAAVFLSGDRRSGNFDPRTGAFVADPAGREVDTDNLVRMAEKMSRRTHGPAIYLARVGIDGSSGHHSLRRSVLEGLVLDRALSVIKQRHGLQGFHLIGQSGGAANIGALLALRNDIGCAVPGSGPLVMSKPATPRPGVDPLTQKYDGATGIAAIVRNRPARIIVITDPQDRTVPLRSQSAFVQALAQAGGAAEQYFVTASDQNHHGVTSFAMAALSGCITGKSRDEIAQYLDRLGQRLTARKDAAGGTSGTSGPGDAGAAPLPPD